MQNFVLGLMFFCVVIVAPPNRTYSRAHGVGVSGLIRGWSRRLRLQLACPKIEAYGKPEQTDKYPLTELRPDIVRTGVAASGGGWVTVRLPVVFEALAVQCNAKSVGRIVEVREFF